MVKLLLSTVVGGGRRRFRRQASRRSQAIWKPTSLVEGKEIKRRGSHLRTWQRYHDMATRQDPVSCFPLMPAIVERIALKMRQDGYKSVQNYLITAKREHVTRGHDVSGNLRITLKDAGLMAKRKLGPSRSARSFSIPRMALGMQIGMSPASILFDPHIIVVFGAMCLLRGVEVIDMKCQDIVLDFKTKRITIRVCSSKTDVSSRGFRFTWQCLCANAERSDRFELRQMHEWIQCPYHAGTRYAMVHHGMKTCAEKAPVPGGQSAFFITKHRTEITTAQIGSFLERFHERFSIDSDETHDDGEKSFGGHSCRRTGTQTLYKMGMSSEMIRRLARWRSQMIERYLGQAPVSDLGTWSFAEKAQSSDVNTALKMETLMGAVRSAIAEAFQAMRSTKTSTDKSETKTSWSEDLVVMTRAPGKPKKMHSIRRLQGAITLWSCNCGFKFGSTIISGQSEILDCQEALKLGASRCMKGCF